MQRSRIFAVLGGIFLLGQACLFFVLPFSIQSIFASPDETAVMQAATLYAKEGSMRLVDPLLVSFPWLHPRSFVTQADRMVPVGFIGWPLILSLVARITTAAVPFVTPILALSVAYPLFCFSRRLGRLAQWVAMSLWLSFPPVILYANRGLFPNLPVVCLAVWAAYLLWSHRSVRAMAGAGILAGMACIIRPTEMIWIVAWLGLVLFVGQESVIPSESASRGIPSTPAVPTKRFLRSSPSLLGRNDRLTSAIFFTLGFSVPVFLYLFVAWQTYGSPWRIGYFLHDPVISPSSILPPPGAPVIHWPFGFHPRNVWFNVKNYLFGVLWPWAILALASFALFVRRRATRPILIVALWTLSSLALLYGQAIYQDHVGVNVVSLGNSYLRYLLPVAVFAALGGAALAHEAVRRWSRMGSILTIVACLALSVWGSYVALQHPTEGVLAVRHELGRYMDIRRATLEIVSKHSEPHQSVILSERSDKIFFPLFRVASPLPSIDEIRRLADLKNLEDGMGIGEPGVLLYAETLDAKRIEEFDAHGIRPVPLMANRNQTLYRLESFELGL